MVVVARVDGCGGAPDAHHGSTVTVKPRRLSCASRPWSPVRWIAPTATKQSPSRSKRSSTGSQRSEEHTSELQSLMRISDAVFCLKKKKISIPTKHTEVGLTKSN